jgi:hypothetical protein
MTMFDPQIGFKDFYKYSIDDRLQIYRDWLIYMRETYPHNNKYDDTYIHNAVETMRSIFDGTYAGTDR